MRCAPQARAYTSRPASPLHRPHPPLPLPPPVPRCWDQQPEVRPSADEVLKQLTLMLAALDRGELVQ